MIQINQHRSFSKQSDYAAFASVRLHNDHLKKLGGRNAWVFIQSPEGEVYRTIRGNGTVTPFPEDALESDYDTSVELAIHNTEPVKPQGIPEKKFYSCNLKVRPVRGPEVIKAHWRHPDPAYRIPLQISIVLGSLSVALGFIGMILGIMSVVGG